MIALLTEWKSWLVALLIGAAAAIVGGLALKVRAAESRAAKLQTAADRARDQAANATAQRRTVVRVMRETEEAETRVRKDNPIDPDKPDDFSGGW